MKIYVRKIFSHDITHEVSVRTDIVNDFFEGFKDFNMKGINSSYEGTVTINAVTDPRFGGEFKTILKKEGDIEENDILLIYKKRSEYVVEIIKKCNVKYNTYFELFKNIDRHIILNIDVNKKETVEHDEILSFDELVSILKEYRDKYKKSVGVHLFGIEYAKYIKDINRTKMMEAAGIPISMKHELQKGISLSNYVGKLAIINEVDDSDYKKENIILDKDRITGAYNKIYYGVPGSGKSYIVENEFPKEQFYKIRTTFHPEYTNSDFIGQIIPGIKEDRVTYDFHPGAFTEALEYALLNEKEKVVLVIEEINRGNSSAIFGDIFQLLDRDEKGSSKYKIFNGAIKNYFIDKEIEIDKIYIPSNLWIIGTMNTSDQNVFTLDTAFKRRWKMEYIKNEFSDNTESKLLAKTKLPYDKVNGIAWQDFVLNINKKIIENNNGINAEDKQLGVYFVTIEELNDDKEFSEKVLSYLWEDIAKLNNDEWFPDVNSYDELLSKYKSENIKIFGIFDQLIKEAQLDNPESDVINIEQLEDEKYNT